jgi:DNA repair protein RecN (Recombination protein N)
MPHALFAVALEPVAPGPFGVERVIFTFTANPGQAPAPLATVASGGELARIGLAIQVASTGAEEIPTVVFDEVDVGIGGSVAAVVGRLMQRLGTWRQVLAVTHQPQVAACADWQWRVTKESRTEGVVTRVEPLGEAERVSELARMVAGETIDEAALAHARSLLAMRERREA